MTAGLAGCIAAYWHETARQERKVMHWFLENGALTEQAFAQLRAMGAQPPAHSIVAFLNDPFPGQWDTLFIAALVWRDPTIDIWLQRENPLPDPQLAQAKFIFDYVDGRFVLVKSPSLVKSW